MDNANIDESIIKVNEAIILSMTKEERLNPKIISTSRKKEFLVALAQTHLLLINC